MSAAADSSSRLRILCLHGYRQSDVIFREKTGSLRKILKKHADLHYACAPHLPNAEQNDRGEGRGWWFSLPDSLFSSRDVTDMADGFDESVQCITKFIAENGPFDGIMGFSQGASMAHLILAMQQKGQLIVCPKFSFAVFFSGFLSLSSVHAKYTEEPFKLPSLHVFGMADDIVLPEVSERLLSHFASSSPPPCVIRHEGKHFIPANVVVQAPTHRLSHRTAAEEEDERGSEWGIGEGV